jgi:hypothetical protein
MGVRAARSGHAAPMPALPALAMGERRTGLTKSPFRALRIIVIASGRRCKARRNAARRAS